LPSDPWEIDLHLECDSPVVIGLARRNSKVVRCAADAVTLPLVKIAKLDCWIAEKDVRVGIGCLHFLPVSLRPDACDQGRLRCGWRGGWGDMGWGCRYRNLQYGTGRTAGDRSARFPPLE